MNFRQFVLETKVSKFEDLRLQIIESIKSQKLEKKHCLYRGFVKEVDQIGDHSIRQNRHPLDTSKMITSRMDEEFVKRFSKPIRTSTAFASFSVETARSYTDFTGSVVILVPKPSTNFYSSKIVTDMTQFFYDDNMISMLNKINFTKDEKTDLALSVGMELMELGEYRFPRLYTKAVESKKDIEFKMFDEVFKRTAETYDKFTTLPPYTQYRTSEIMIDSDSYYYVRVSNYTDIDTYKRLLEVLDEMKIPD